MVSTPGIEGLFAVSGYLVAGFDDVCFHWDQTVVETCSNGPASAVEFADKRHCGRVFDRRVNGFKGLDIGLEERLYTGEIEAQYQKHTWCLRIYVCMISADQPSSSASSAQSL